jgi:hypothetical protein
MSALSIGAEVWFRGTLESQLLSSLSDIANSVRENVMAVTIA